MQCYCTWIDIQVRILKLRGGGGATRGITGRLPFYKRAEESARLFGKREAMGADNSRLLSHTEEEDVYSHTCRRSGSERREATSTTIDIGFAIRARKPSPRRSLSDGELGVLKRMVSGEAGTAWRGIVLAVY